MDDLLTLLSRRVLLADGAMGTMLQAAGLKPGECVDEWNITRSKDVAAVHKAYTDAGSDIILTNTFGANRIKLAKCGLEDKVTEINKLGVKLVKDATEDKCLVAGDIGPSGEIPEPAGTVKLEDLEECFKQQAEVLARAGANLIVIETMSSVEEAVCAVKAALTTGLAVVATMTFEKARVGYRTAMGVSIEGAVKILVDAGTSVVGANCGQGPEEAVEIIGEMANLTKVPLWSKPNAGMPQIVNGNVVYPASPADMAEGMKNIIKAGAKVVGGCCGTTPEHIKSIKRGHSSF